MKSRVNIIEAAMKYKQIVIAFVLLMMIIGTIGLLKMPRREFPEFVIRQGVILGLYPGKTSEEVEEQLTKVVENYIFGYEEVNKLKTVSNSSEGKMIIYVELNDNVVNSDKFWSKLRHGLDELKQHKLPAGVVALVGSNDFGDVSAMLITVSSEKKSYRQLEEVINELETKIRRIQSVSKIKQYGTQKEQIFIYLDKDKLNEYNVNPASILTSFQIQDLMDYPGYLTTAELEMPVHLPSRYESEEDLEEQVVFTDYKGNVVRLKDISRVERAYQSPSSFIKNNGNNSLLISLEMQKGNNIVEFGEQVNDVINSFSEAADDDVKINVISNLPDVVDNSITHFLKEFLIAIVAVIAVTMILLPFRVSSVAAVTIPISILITIGIMQMLGIELNIVTLAGLIVVLGMVVDNAIVVIDNHVDKLDHGDSPWDAAWKSATELFIPILAATAAITAAFFPLMLFLEGMGKDFVGAFPMTIGIALLVSMLVAIFLVPFMSYLFIKTGLNHSKKPQKRSFLDIVQKAYDKVLDKSFKKPFLTIGLGITIVVLGLWLFSSLHIKMFPAMDRDQFAVEVYLPEGYNLDQTEIVLDSLEKILIGDGRVTNVAAFIGTGSPRFNDLYAPHLPEKNFGQLIVNTKSKEATVEILDEYSDAYCDIFPSAHIKFKQIAMEKFKAPIEVRISGDDISELKAKAKEVSDILKSNANVIWVRNDWGEKRRGITVDLDRDKSNRMGYATTMAATSLLSSLNGIPVATVWEGDYNLDVILTQDNYMSNDINDLNNQYVSSLFGMGSEPLRAIAKIQPDWTEGNITRRDGIRTITVQADIKRDIIYSKVLGEVKNKIDNVKLKPAYFIEFGGDKEATTENMIPLVWSLAVSVLLIFFILLVEFKTTRRAMLIMSTMLLSFPGAALGLWLTGYPFGLTSFVGVIGLVGIVVRNGIILIDYAYGLVKNQNYSFKEAAIQAGKRRMRPVFLTSMAAAMGVVPMIISHSPLWGPLGAVICFGMIVGMVLTLLILPVLYWKTSDNKFANSLINK